MLLQPDTLTVAEFDIMGLLGFRCRPMEGGGAGASGDPNTPRT